MASFGNATPSAPPEASIHCDSLRKYSKAGVNGAASIRSAMIGRRLDEARSISLPTCAEATALSDSTSTSTCAPLIARTIASAYWAPGATSRGASQQLKPALSSPLHTASAVAASAEA